MQRRSAYVRRDIAETPIKVKDAQRRKFEAAFGRDVSRHLDRWLIAHGEHGHSSTCYVEASEHQYQHQTLRHKHQDVANPSLRMAMLKGLVLRARASGRITTAADRKQREESAMLRREAVHKWLQDYKRWITQRRSQNSVAGR